jgi:hypothetical protein
MPPKSSPALSRSDRARLRFLREIVREQNRAHAVAQPPKAPKKNG